MRMIGHINIRLLRSDKFKKRKWLSDLMSTSVMSYTCAKGIFVSSCVFMYWLVG